MLQFDDLRLRTKAMIPIAVAVAATLGVSLLSGVQLGAFATRSSHIIERRDHALMDLLSGARSATSAVFVVARSVLYDADDPIQKNSERMLAETVERFGADLRDASQSLPEKKADLDAFVESFAVVRDDLKRAMDLGRSVPGVAVGRQLTPRELDVLAEATRVLNGADVRAARLNERLSALVEETATENKALAGALRDDGRSALTQLFAGGLLATLLAIALSLWIVTRKIVRPLSTLTARMQSLAAGDLDVEIEGEGRRDEVGEMAAAVRIFRVNAIERKRIEADAEAQRAIAETERRDAAADRTRSADERAAAAQHEAERVARAAAARDAAAAEQARAMRHIGEAIRALAVKDMRHRIGEALHADYEPLRAEFNAALDQLAQAFAEVAGAAGSVHQGTQEIATAANDLARRTEQQASNIEETATALDEITSTVEKTARGAAAARDSVAEARGDAERGAEVIGLTTQAMARIEASARKVSEIIGVIDEIAFQTNLLALNAGVEAARAGEAGRGFAVVASEVRALAQRSADAAKEIKALISASGQEVQNGVALVARTGEALSQIGQTVIRIDDIVSTIAQDSDAQAGGLGEINKAVRQVDQMTQQNAALAEQATAASQSLSRESERLAGLVARFSVERGGDLRAELRRAAPHAFACPNPAPRAAARQARAQVAAVAGRGPQPQTAEDDWKEF